MGSSVGDAFESIGKVVGTAADLIFTGGQITSMYQSHKAQKQQLRAQQNAAAAMAAAMEQQPTVQTSKVAEQQTQNTQATEQAVNTEARRRYTLTKTVNNRPGINSGILTGRKTLG